MTRGETLKLGAVGPSQVKGGGWERGRYLKDGIDAKSNLVFEHVRVENDSNVNLETLPDHPSKGNAGETVTLAVYYRSTPDI